MIQCIDLHEEIFIATEVFITLFKTLQNSSGCATGHDMASGLDDDSTILAAECSETGSCV